MESIREVGGLVLNLYYFIIILMMLLHRKLLGRYVGIIILALSVTLITELSSALIQWYGMAVNTAIFYIVGIIGIVYFLFLFYFYLLMQNKLLKKIQLILVLVHVVNFFVSMFLIADFFLSFPELTNFISIFLILASLFLFLHDTFNSDKVLNIKIFFPFFVAVSLTFIYVGLIPLLFFSKRISLETEKQIFFIMLFSINIIGYSIMTAGIFFAKLTKKV